MVLITAARSCVQQLRAVECLTSYTWQCISEAAPPVLYQPTAHALPFPRINEQWFIAGITTRPGKCETTVVCGQILTKFIFPLNYFKHGGHYKYHVLKSWVMRHSEMYLGADKSLARPGRKQARKHVRDACDFNNIETRTVIKFFFFCKARRRRKFTPFWQKY